jgi:transcription antitermination protein NusB
MSARGKARKRALDILFESEIRAIPVLALLDERSTEGSPPVPPYAAELVEGVQRHRFQIDGLLAEYAQGWTLERMPAVDRNILRIGAFELIWQDTVPDAVAISESVALARDLSTDGSPSFVNGMLARLLELKPELLREAPDDAASSEEPAEGTDSAAEDAAPADGTTPADGAAPADGTGLAGGAAQDGGAPSAGAPPAEA